MIGYSVFVIGLAGSEAVQYILSQFLSTTENLYVLLVTTILAVPLFTVADIHYGSGTSRNICGKKRPPDLVENGNIQCEPASSSKEKGMHIGAGLYICTVCQSVCSTHLKSKSRNACNSGFFVVT